MIASNVATNLFAFVLVLGFLIFTHEAGHFFIAKLFRVRVLVFSFGFGQRLFGFRKGDTDYRVSLIPLGGYVRMAGDTPEDNRAPDCLRAYLRPCERIRRVESAKRGSPCRPFGSRTAAVRIRMRRPTRARETTSR